MAFFGRNVEKLSLSYLADRDVKWQSHFGSSLIIPQNVNMDQDTSDPSCNPGYLGG
jgi:hypothetical protein